MSTPTSAPPGGVISNQAHETQYQHPEWSSEGLIERYGAEEGERRLGAAINSLLFGEAVAPVDYDAYIRSENWRLRANDAKRRAGHRCQVCNRPDNLHAHHRTYERLGHEADGDLVVLCECCHKLFHDNGRLAR